MRCLSLYQPWASLVVSGAKRYETRSWRTPYRGPLLIHASKKWSADLADLCGEGYFFDALYHLFPDADARPVRRVMVESVPRGVLLGSVELVRCVRTEAAVQEWSIYEDGAAERYAQEIAFGDYTPGRWAWELRNPKPLPRPIPYRGAMGVFDVPDGTVTEEPARG